MSVSLLPTFNLYLFLIASLATWSIRSSCHNHGMIVGDGHGSWKTEGGHSQGVVTAKQLYLVLSENETPAAKALVSKPIRKD